MKQKRQSSIRDADLLAALLGAVLGMFLFKRVPGALICAVFGVIMGRRLLGSPRARRVNSATSPGGPPQRVEAHIRLFGAIAREGGEFDDAARKAARSWFAVDLHCSPAEMASIDALLNAESKRGRETARQAAAQFMAIAKPARRDRSSALFSLFRVALTRPLTPARERGLEEAAAGLELSRDDYSSMRADFVATVRGRATESDYRTLDLDPGASEQAVRERYRECAKTHHPDLHQHLGGEFANVAAERFKAIQAAYDRIVAAHESAKETGERPRAARCPNCRKFTALEERACIRCGHVKLEMEHGRKSLRCGSCGQGNPLDAMPTRGAVACTNCRIVLVQ